MLLLFTAAIASILPIKGDAIPDAFAGRDGALVLVNCATGQTQRYQPERCATKLPPCSTFKIWNTAIGLELGLLTSADQPFWKWDGVKREIEPWNHDLTLRQAYAASCVPAFQALARHIGPSRMNEWLRKIGYGNQDTSSGNDVFWLPAPGRTPLLISADEQAALLRRLVRHDVPFSAKNLAILKDIMTAKQTVHGTLYGKTGSGEAVNGNPAIGWFVGYVISGKTTLAFACLLFGDHVMGKDARAAIEEILDSQDLL